MKLYEKLPVFLYWLWLPVVLLLLQGCASPQAEPVASEPEKQPLSNPSGDLLGEWCKVCFNGQAMSARRHHIGYFVSKATPLKYNGVIIVDGGQGDGENIRSFFHASPRATFQTAVVKCYRDYFNIMNRNVN